MNALTSIYGIITFFLIVATFGSRTDNKHWSVRVFDFLRLQLFAIKIILLLLGLFLPKDDFYIVNTSILFLLVALIYEFVLLYPYLSNSFKKKTPTEKIENTISLISINVLQSNDQYNLLIELIQKEQPDILLTIESDQKWENALKVIEPDYPYSKKIALDNTYGMHFYSKLKASAIKVHHFLTEDRPAIEARLHSETQGDFIFYGVHPPPPSPTEEPTALKKDGELVLLAKEIKRKNLPIVVAGDFNTVAWSRISTLFCKTTGLLDGREGRGFISTFPANYPAFRFPIDLIYHSTNVKLHHLDTLEPVNSDHLPLYAEFTINQQEEQKNPEVSDIKEKEIEEIIQKGKQEQE